MVLSNTQGAHVPGKPYSLIASRVSETFSLAEESRIHDSSSKTKKACGWLADCRPMKQK